MTKENELKQLLENVSDTYEDFVTGGLRVARKHNAHDKLINFIKNNPEAKSSDIIRFETEEILGIKPISK